MLCCVDWIGLDWIRGLIVRVVESVERETEGWIDGCRVDGRTDGWVGVLLL